MVSFSNYGVIVMNQIVMKRYEGIDRWNRNNLIRWKYKFAFAVVFSYKHFKKCFATFLKKKV